MPLDGGSERGCPPTSIAITTFSRYSLAPTNEGADMSSESFSGADDWLNELDLDAIADPSDKLAECEYFLKAATDEEDRDKFRWLISAFFGAAYSFFEINALRAYHGFSNPNTGDSIESEEALETLRRYVRVSQDVKRPNFVKTAGQHEITLELYNLRKGNTHHFPLSIMTNGQRIPEGYQFGSLSGRGVPALAFCREVLALIREVENELQAIF